MLRLGRLMKATGYAHPVKYKATLHLLLPLLSIGCGSDDMKLLVQRGGVERGAAGELGKVAASALVRGLSAWSADTGDNVEKTFRLL